VENSDELEGLGGEAEDSEVGDKDGSEHGDESKGIDEADDLDDMRNAAD
jgi:hypothetical protein